MNLNNGSYSHPFASPRDFKHGKHAAYSLVMNLVEKTSTTFLGEPIEDEFVHFIQGELKMKCNMGGK